MYIYPPPCPCGTKWSDRGSTGVLWIVELTSFKGPPPPSRNYPELPGKSCMTFFKKTSLAFMDRRFFQFLTSECSRMVPKSTRNGTQVNSQGPPEKSPKKNIDFNNLLMYFPKCRHA